MKFTKDDAIRRCERKLPQPPISERGIGCFSCYYHDGRCELGFEYIRQCAYYVEDVSFTNRVRHNILHNSSWIKRNWERLCGCDKELFRAIYGHDCKNKLIYSDFRSGKCFMQEKLWETLKCKNCGSELEMIFSNEYEEVKACPMCAETHVLIKKIRKEEK